MRSCLFGTIVIASFLIAAAVVASATVMAVLSYFADLP